MFVDLTVRIVGFLELYIVGFGVLLTWWTCVWVCAFTTFIIWLIDWFSDLMIVFTAVCLCDVFLNCLVKCLCLLLLILGCCMLSLFVCVEVLYTLVSLLVLPVALGYWRDSLAGVGFDWFVACWCWLDFLI